MARKVNNTAKQNSRRANGKVVDPMLVNAKVAEANNDVLDEALADYEMKNEMEGAEGDFDEMTEVAEMRVDAEEMAEDLDEDLTEIEEVEDKAEPRAKKGQEDLDDIYADFAEEDVEDILMEGDDLDSKKDKKKKKEPKLKKNGKPKMKLWKKITIGVVLVILVAAGCVAWYFLRIANGLGNGNVFEGNAMDILKAEPMAKDENGRTNILVFGTSEDEEDHGGAMLADSILVVSFNQDTKEAKTFSVPRDLWVNYTVAGEDTLFCSVGYKGKINAEYLCATKQAEQDVPEVPDSCQGKSGDELTKCRERVVRSEAARYFARKVSEVTGVNIQYFVAVDWTVLITTVDTLGGIDVDIWATDDRGISDVCQQLQLSKGVHHLNGEEALKLARARGACHAGSGSIKQNYGLANSNFDREKNQQRIINAIKDKALNVGILADPGKVLPIIDTLGDNIRTNIAMSEVRTILDFALNLKGDIESIETQNLFSTGMVGSQSVVVPKGAPLDPNAAKLYDYTAIRAYFQEQLTKDDGVEGGEDAEAADAEEEAGE